MTKIQTAVNRNTLGALIIGLAFFAPAGVNAQVSRVRTDDGAILTSTTPKASSIVPEANPAVEESLPSGVSVVYSNLGTGSSVYNAGTGWTVAGAEANDYPLTEAMSFTPKNNYRLVRISFAITYLQGTDGMTLFLADDNGGIPGDTIFTAGFENMADFGTCCKLVTVKLANRVNLNAGQKYWLYALPADTTSYLIWNLDTTAKNGYGAVSEDNGTTWTATTLKPLGAFEIFGDLLTP